MNLNLEGYNTSIIDFKKGDNYDSNDFFCKWYTVTLNIKNKYFSYNESQEMLLEHELRDIYNVFNKCLNDQLENNEEMTFIEPDLEIYVYASKGDEDKDYHLADIKICLNFDEVGYSGDYYSFLISDQEMIMIKNRIGELLNISK